MPTNPDFLWLLRAAKILATSGNTEHAEALLMTARELVPAREVGLCPRCLKRRRVALDALMQAENDLYGKADGKAQAESERVAP